MKQILWVSFYLILSIPLLATDSEGFYTSCYGFERSPNSFESCVNSNFRYAGRDFGVFVGSCYGADYSPSSYESCVNSNFRTLDRASNSFLTACYGATYSPFSFESCVNSNFRSLNKILQKLPEQDSL